MARGRKPDLVCRQQVLELCSQQIPLVQIAHMLSISKYSVYHIVRSVVLAPPVLCGQCNAIIAPIGLSLDNRKGRVLCRSCLRIRPEVSFATRLRSLRLAYGLSRAQLALLSKVCAQTIY